MACRAIVSDCIVDVGAVDLDPLAHLVDAEQFGQDDGQRVGLLAAGATSAPNPDGLGRAFGGQHAGEDVGGKEAPGGRVAEESR